MRGELTLAVCAFLSQALARQDYIWLHACYVLFGAVFGIRADYFQIFIRHFGEVVGSIHMLRLYMNGSSVVPAYNL